MSGSAYYIPASELADVLGLDGARKVTEAFGGMKLYVREHVRDDHLIAKAIGLDLARLLASHVATGIGGMGVEFPMASASAFNGYRKRLRELAQDFSLTEAQIASQLGVHGRTVRRMRATLRRERTNSIER